MMQQDKIEKVSDALATAWRDGGSVNISENLWPADLEESMAIQDAFDVKIKEEITGWKIAATDKLSQRAQGLDHPAFFGRYYKSVTQESPALFRMSDFRNQPILVEAELGLRLGQDLPTREESYNIEEIHDAVEAVVMTIDVVDTRWYCDPSDWPVPGCLDALKAAADFSNAGAFVVGDEVAGWRNLDLASLPIAIYLDGKFASRGGVIGRAPSEPFPRDRRLDFSEMVAGLRWTANALSERGLGMRKGQTITTGSAAQVFAQPGAEATMRYGEGGEFGEIQITIA
jgi:2-keto-4-pentenoate hydratase